MKFKSIDQVWNAIESGKTIYCGSDAYQLTIEDARVGSPEAREYWLNHFSFKNGKTLRVTCVSNWFGSIINESDLSRLYVKESKNETN